MAVRTSIDEVKKIIGTDLTDDQITAFIADASLIVDEQLEPQGLTDARLTLIEKWLAAHLLALRDRQVRQEAVGDEWSATYDGSTGMGLEATLYGQQAINNDPTGTLATIGLKQTVFEVWSEYDVQT